VGIGAVVHRHNGTQWRPVSRRNRAVVGLIGTVVGLIRAVGPWWKAQQNLEWSA
jgi:hypothetical protein